jgi:sulfate transport system substrate-binding protein
MWDINAIYGAGLKLSEIKTGRANPDNAYKLLRAVQSNVKVMHKSGRESVDKFLAGIGDVVVTYENEICLKKSYGYDLPYLVPETTILIENPIALVDKYVEKHQNREVVEAFLNFVVTEEMQRAFAKYGFRAVNLKVAAEFAAQYPEPKYLFDIHYLGGWPQVMETIYGPAAPGRKL